MEVRYRKELNESYLILEEDYPGDEYTSRILSENRIDGLLSMSQRLFDENIEYYYAISGKQSLQKILEKRQITGEEIRTLLYGIRQVLESLEEYLLEADRILLEPEFIYASPDLKEICLCCHPGYQENIFDGFRGLTRFLLNKIDHMEENSVEMAYGLFQVASRESFRLDELLKVLETSEEELSEPEQIAVRWEPEEERPEQKDEELPEHLMKSAKKTPGIILIPIAAAVGIGCLVSIGVFVRRPLPARMLMALLVIIAAALMGYILRKRKQNTNLKTEYSFVNHTKNEATAPLEGAFWHLPRARLLVSQNSLRYETITMKSMPFTIGKLVSACDEVIESPVISRIHARIEEREDGFYLTDCSSTNGTFLNGNRLEPNRPYLMKEGDEVGLADLKYIFQ